MAIDPNNPLEFHPSDIKTLRDFATSPPEAIIDDLLRCGGQTILTSNGRFIAMIEPIAQDEQTQAALAARFATLNMDIATETAQPHEMVASNERSELALQIAEEAKRLAELNES